MKGFLQKTLSVILTLALVCPLALTPALASEALGADVGGRDTVLNRETQLSTNVFWSEAYSDLRTENLVTYTPNESVKPIITYGGTLSAKNTVSKTAKALEDQGMRVVAGINGDFYNMGNGLPVGLTIAQGRLLSSDGGYHAIGFRSDGTAILGRPGIKTTVDLGFQKPDPSGSMTQVVRPLAGVNKARVSAGGIYLYTYEFNGKHTTGTTEPGVDLICSLEGGALAVGQTAQLRVEQVIPEAVGTAIPQGKYVLSVNVKSDPYYVEAMREVTAGSVLQVTTTAADPAWNDVEFGMGALYPLMENGVMASGLEKKPAPRTAVGQKPDGTLIFYTIDGRKPGHSIGATMPQVADRLKELGCVNALCLDGGGSTTLTVTRPDQMAAKTVNQPSGGAERAVTNHIFLVSNNQPTGILDHFFVQPEQVQVLAGSKVRISASAVDTAFMPMKQEPFTLSASEGEIEGEFLKTPNYSATISVEANGNGGRGTATVQTIADPDEVAIRQDGKIIQELRVAPGSVTQLTASAAHRHLPLYADASAFTWTTEGNAGTIDAQGRFTAATPGSGIITVSAGGRSASVKVTVDRMALQEVENFEAGPGRLSGVTTGGLDLRGSAAGEPVRYGLHSARLDYRLTPENAYGGEWTLSTPMQVSGPYSALNFWVYGDGSGNTLELVGEDGYVAGNTLLSLNLNFTGWKQISMPWSAQHRLSSIRIMAPVDVMVDEWGNSVSAGAPVTAPSGTIYLDQLVASFEGTTDEKAPSVKITGVEEDSSNGLPVVIEGMTEGQMARESMLKATVRDEMDGVLPKSAITVTLDGKPIDFLYDASAGKLSAGFRPDGQAHRLTVTAQDASGNRNRASHDVAASKNSKPKFTDTAGYWGRTYVDFMHTSGITTGYQDGSFRPNDKITRAQFSVMLYRYLKLDGKQYANVSLPFADLGSIPEYALPAIRALYSRGIVTGSTGADGNIYFQPNQSLTRAQAATMIGRTQAKGYPAGSLNFTDAGSIPAYAQEFISTMAAQGVIGGYKDGSFQPHAPITRGQMAKILYNLM